MANRPEWIGRPALAAGCSARWSCPSTRSRAGRARLRSCATATRRVLLLQPALAKHRFLDDLLRAPPRDRARARPGGCAARRCRSCGASSASGSTRRAAASSPGARCSRTGRASPTRCSTRSPPRSRPSDDGLVIYTSGTTAQPKGVLHTAARGGAPGCRFADAAALRARRPRLHHVSVLLDGRASRCRSARRSRRAPRSLLQEIFEPGAALALIERERATARPRLAAPAEGAGRAPDAARRDLSSVRKIELQLAAREARRHREGPLGHRTPPTGSPRPSRSQRRSPRDAPARAAPGSSGRALPGMAAAHRRSRHRRAASARRATARSR